ncbi:hypothetical protein LCGC14_2473340 [marine sediment metagenome]|uniref:Uncharacterized protein n=1 Tax=marine sediment metagenome TaxID=412755 RepID=A0A0F9BXL0_9ZZZZ
MKLALECSDELLDMVQPFADFDWILANRFLESDVYAEYYRNSTNVKFVDNSVTELGKPVSLDDLEKVMKDVKGNYVVSPDWIGEYQQTVEAYKECLAKFGKERAVGVLQGSSPEEALKCLDVYDNHLVLVPYRVGGSVKEDPDWIKALRRELVVAHIPDDRLIHLLGFNTLDELHWYTNRPNVCGIDTDVPIRAGLLVQDFDGFDRMQKTDGIKLNKETWAGVCRNIALLRKYMS